MAVKIYLNDLIHRISALPLSFDLLVALINSLFTNSLPHSWTLQYLDQDGEKVSLTEKSDYKSILEMESQSLTFTLKIYIVPSQPQRLSHTQDILSAFELTESEIFSQSSVSEQSDYELVRSLIESESRTTRSRVEKKESPEERFGQAKHLIKKLVKGELSATDCAQISARLNALLENFTLEEKQRLHKKKDDFERRKRQESFEFSELQDTREIVPVETNAKMPVGNCFTCNGCQEKGITGIRYKCSECEDFNFCENCEENKGHPHAFLKFRGTGAPKSQRVTRTKRGFLESLCLLKEVIMKMKQQPKEKLKKMCKIFKTFVKLGKAFHRNRLEKIKKRQLKLLSQLPEENRKIFEEEFAAIPGGLSKKELGYRLLPIVRKFYQIYCPGNDELFMELEGFGHQIIEKKEKKAKQLKECRKAGRGCVATKLRCARPLIKVILVAVLLMIFMPRCYFK